jgi:hypothetical protein
LFFTPQARGTALARSTDGSLYVAGSFAGIIDFGSGSLASMSELSDLGDAGLEDAGLGDAALGGCLLTCAPDAVVVKLDAAHAHKWSKQYGGKEGDAAQGIAVDSAGNVLVTGVFRGTADFDGASLTAEGADQRDVFLVKTDAGGSLIRALDFGGAGDDLGYGVATHGTDVVVVGSFTGSIDFGRGAVPSGGTEYQAFVAKLDESGQEVWSRSLPATIHSLASGVAVDSAGNLFVAGLYRGELNLGSETLSGDFDEAFVVKLDAAGNVLWGHSYGAYENDGASAIAVGPSDEVTVVGSVSYYPVDFGGGALRGGIFDDLFAVTLDAQGTHLCSRRYAASDGSSAAHGVAVDATGRVLIAGSFNRSVDFGKGTLVSTGGSDGVVLALEGSAQ